MNIIYKTNEVAKLIGIHPNTVRMYEEMGFVAKAPRKENGYRIFFDLHVDQFKLARKALQIEVLQNGLRKKVINIVKLSARCEFEKALALTREYISTIDTEIENANEAVTMVHQLLDEIPNENAPSLKRSEVSDLLGITMDTLRNWEMNGLLKVKRKENGYRLYVDDDIRKIKIIRSLRCANYSLSSILRMMCALEAHSNIDIDDVLNSPDEEEDIISVCDKLVISLNSAKENALLILSMLNEMKSKYSNPPL